MKLSRLPVILAVAVALIFVALPATADMRGIPASDGRPQASIEGTISSVSSSTVALLDGLVSFDATGAAVRFVDGRDATVSTLAAGQRVLAILDATASPLKATTVVIISDRSDVTLTGKADAVDAGAGTLTVLGFKVNVTAKTVFGGPWDGAGTTSLADVKAGDLVLVDAAADSGALAATKVMKLSPSPDPTQRIHGTVESIGTDSWTIKLADGTTKTVKIDATTKVVGAPKVGDEVEILVRQQSDGSLLAVLIQATVAPPAATTERFMGTVKSISATTWTIGPKAGTAPDRVFEVNAATKIVGAPKVGDEVGVMALKNGGGTSVAVIIAKAGPAPAVPVVVVTLDGMVTGLPAGPSIGPAHGLVGTWVIAGTRIVVTPTTILKGNPKIGDKVHVDGQKLPNGTIIATFIEKM